MISLKYQSGDGREQALTNRRQLGAISLDVNAGDQVSDDLQHVTVINDDLVALS